MSDERDREIAETYKSRGGTARLLEDRKIARDEALDPPEAHEYWNEFIKPRVDAGDYHGIFQYLL
jgi:hypothetical protein